MKKQWDAGFLWKRSRNAGSGPPPSRFQTKWSQVAIGLYGLFFYCLTCLKENTLSCVLNKWVKLRSYAMEGTQKVQTGVSSLSACNCKFQIGSRVELAYCINEFLLLRLEQLLAFPATFFSLRNFLYSEQFLVFYQFQDIGAAFSTLVGFASTFQNVLFRQLMNVKKQKRSQILPLGQIMGARCVQQSLMLFYSKQ